MFGGLIESSVDPGEIGDANMKRSALFLLAIWAGTLVGCTGCATAPITADQNHRTVYSLIVSEGNKIGICSATAIATSAILTAEHCVSEKPSVIWLNGKKTAVKEILTDKNDHAIVLVETKFPYVATWGLPVKQREHVYFYGNPDGLLDLYREGVVSYVDAEGSMVLDINGWYGDSGSGVFDHTGKLVAVISRKHNTEGFRLLYTFAFAFDKAAVKKAMEYRPLQSIARTP